MKPFQFPQSAFLRGHAVLLLALNLLLIPGARATLSLNVGTRPLLPNTPNQTLEFQIFNDGLPVAVAGLIFNVQVADGGPMAGGAILGPRITGIDLLTGTIFSGNNAGQTSGAFVDQFRDARTTTAAGTVNVPSGLSRLAQVTFDTTGFAAPGSWALSIGNTLNGPSRYFGADASSVPINIQDGTLEAVPEASTLWAAAGLAAFALLSQLKRLLPFSKKL